MLSNIPCGLLSLIEDEVEFKLDFERTHRWNSYCILSDVNLDNASELFTTTNLACFHFWWIDFEEWS